MFPFRLPQSEFGLNVLRLMTGTTIAKAISIAVIPILTRLYSPSDFGLFGFYASAVAVCAVLATGRYELAVVQARAPGDAEHLVVGSALLAAAFSGVLLIVILVAQQPLVSALGAPEIGPWLYLLPLGVFLVAIYQTFSYWLNRNKEYRRMGGNRALQAGLAAGGNLAFGVLGFGVAGLILAQIIAQILTMLLLFRRFWARRPEIRRDRTLSVYRRYLNYPKYDLAAGSMNVSAQQAPNLLLPPLFGASLAGQYYLVQRVFMLPIALFSSSVGSVFRQAATEQYHATGSFRKIFWSVFGKLVIVAVPPTIIFMIFAEELFAFVFGPDWVLAGEYARILAPMFMLKFIISPLTSAFYIRNKLHLNTIGQFAYLVIMVGSVVAGYLAGEIVLTLYLISILSSVLYLCYFAVSMRLAA